MVDEIFCETAKVVVRFSMFVDYDGVVVEL